LVGLFPGFIWIFFGVFTNLGIMWNFWNRNFLNLFLISNINSISLFDFNFQLDMLLVHPKSSVVWKFNYNAPEKLEKPGFPVNSPRASGVHHLISGTFHS
jgi:hypothetical protein